jgi:pimeloyl-ACP methyl ester carboxylesterase
MATFVLIHGAWGGGWEWGQVERLLRERGHEATRPTLTGLGERAHLVTPDVTLDTHVEDVVRHLEFEGLLDVVLCGHSYGGMVATGVAERVPERLRRLVYVDAVVPNDGESMFDVLPPGWVSELRASVTHGVLPLPFSFDDAAATNGKWYAERTVPQPAGTFEQAVRVGGGSEAVPRAYIRCLESDAPMEPFAERARTAGWWYRELASAHDAQVHHPEALVDLLVAAAA